MKNIYTMLGLLALLFVGNAGQAQTTLLQESFESSTFPPTGWTLINAGTGNAWQQNTDPSYSKSGSNSMYYSYSSTSAANAWAISPSIAMTAGVTYRISYWYSVDLASYPEKLKITLGNGATVAAQTTILHTYNSLTNTSFLEGVDTYVPTVSGNFNLGINCFSDADEDALIIDSIVVQQLSGCSGTPTGGTATGPAQACAGARINLSVAGNTTGLAGITYKWQTTTIGGSSWTDIPGATTATVSVVQPAAGADYRCVTTCTNSSSSANSTVASVALQTASCPPANDDYCGAITLALNGASDCQNTTSATSVNDPSFSSSTPNNTLWYKYTPTVTGQINIVMTRPSGVTTGLLNAWVGIYTATGTCPSLVLTQVLPAMTGFDLTTNPSVTVTTPTLTAGTTYYFMVDGNSGATGQYCIALASAAAPPACTTNISPANAATNVPYVGGIALSWNGSATADSYDVYFGTTNPPTTMIGNTTTTSASITGGLPSTQYYWYIVPKTAGVAAVGCVSNTTSFTTGAVPAAPANDDCTGAIAVSAYFPVAGTTVSATQSLAAEVCASYTGNANDDVWFKFKTSVAGTATITLTPIGSSFDAVIIAYSGVCGSFTTIGCADATAGGGAETLSLTGLAANTTYYFRVYGYGASGTEGSFTLTATGGALPVSVTDFKGIRQGSINLLSWTTATEINNTGFELQRSVDGTNFSALAFITSKAANGNSNGSLTYTFADSKSLTTGLYYRLKQIDKDGKSTLSPVVFIKGIKATKLELVSVYPNPVAETLNLSVASPKADKVTFMVSDLAGKVIMTKLTSVNNGDNNIQLNVSSLAKGTYTIKAVCADGCETAISKFIKN